MRSFVESVMSSVRRSALSFGMFTREFFAGYYYYAYFYALPSNRTAATF